MYVYTYINTQYIYMYMYMYMYIHIYIYIHTYYSGMIFQLDDFRQWDATASSFQLPLPVLGLQHGPSCKVADAEGAMEVSRE